MLASLVLSEGGEVLGEFELANGRTTIGRHPDNDILLNNSAVSARHAAIVITGKEVFLEDRDSRNGTFINGSRVRRHLLRDGDVFSITRYEFRYVAGDPSEAEIAQSEPDADSAGPAADEPAATPRRATGVATEGGDEGATTDFLEQLRQEADEREAKDDEAERSEKQRAELVRTKVRPRLNAVYKYLSSLAVQLNRLNPEVNASYEIEGYGSLSKLRQHDYRVTAEQPEKLDKFVFSFVREGEGRREFKKQTPVQVSRQRDYLWSHNLRFTSKVDKKGTGTFYLDPRVPVSFEFFTDFQNARIGLRVRNAVSLGSSTYSYDPDFVDNHLLDELAKYVLNKPNRFNELSGNVLSESTRTRLRLQLDEMKKGQEQS